MITITNGKHTTEVSKGAYELMFKNLGYSEVNNKAPIVEKNNKGNQEPKPAKK